jgi:hypothetical protein
MDREASMSLPGLNMRHDAQPFPLLRGYCHRFATEEQTVAGQRLAVEGSNLALSPAHKLQSDPWVGIVTAVMSMPPNRPTIGWFATPNRSRSHATFPRSMKASRARRLPGHCIIRGHKRDCRCYKQEGRNHWFHVVPPSLGLWVQSNSHVTVYVPPAEEPNIDCTALIE